MSGVDDLDEGELRAALERARTELGHVTERVGRLEAELGRRARTAATDLVPGRTYLFSAPWLRGADGWHAAAYEGVALPGDGTRWATSEAVVRRLVEDLQAALRRDRAAVLGHTLELRWDGTRVESVLPEGDRVIKLPRRDDGLHEVPVLSGDPWYALAPGVRASEVAHLSGEPTPADAVPAAPPLPVVPPVAPNRVFAVAASWLRLPGGEGYLAALHGVPHALTEHGLRWWTTELVVRQLPELLAAVPGLVEAGRLHPDALERLPTARFAQRRLTVSFPDHVTTWAEPDEAGRWWLPQLHRPWLLLGPEEQVGTLAWMTPELEAAADRQHQRRRP